MQCRSTPVIAAVLLAVSLQLAAFDIRAQPTERIGRFEFSVRHVKPAELPGDTSREWLEFFGPGLISGALGMAAPPMYASGLVIGGLILAPGALIISDIERRTWQRVVDALKSADFEHNLLLALQRRAARAFPAGEGGIASVELMVNGYGLVGARPDRACFIANADLIVRAGRQEFLHDRLSIAEANPSVDAPPAQCSSLDRFAARDGQLVRDTAAEYAEVLAAMVIDRLQGMTQR
jgi:hypothetical protein